MKRFRGLLLMAAALLLSAADASAIPFEPSFNVPQNQTALFTVNDVATRSCGTGFFSAAGKGKPVHNPGVNVLDSGLAALNLDIDSITYTLNKNYFSVESVGLAGVTFGSTVKAGGTIKLEGDLDGYGDPLLQASAVGGGNLDIVLPFHNVVPKKILANDVFVGVFESAIKITGGAIYDWLIAQNAPTQNGAIIGYLTGIIDVSMFNKKDYIGITDLTFYAPKGGGGGGTEVPEPASVVLMASGLGGLVVRRRRALQTKS